MEQRGVARSKWGMELWSWQADQWTRAPWTLWTSAFVHLSGRHAAVNLASLLALGILARQWRCPARSLLAALWAWPFGVAALTAWPEVSSYSGLSGPLHGLASVLAVQQLVTVWRAERRVSLAALALLSGVGLKLGIEQGWSHPIVWDPDWGFQVVRAAHLSGAACGLAAVLLVLAFRRPAPLPARP